MNEMDGIESQYPVSKYSCEKVLKLIQDKLVSSCFPFSPENNIDKSRAEIAQWSSQVATMNLELSRNDSLLL